MTKEQKELVKIAKKLPNDDLTKKKVDWNKISEATKEWLKN